MLTKQESKVLHDLLIKEGIRGKKPLADFLWMNEHEPKYKIGECYLVSSPDCKICGKRVINFKGKVKEVSHFINSRTWNYGFDLEIVCNGRKHTSYIAAIEEKVGARVEDNVNVLDDGDENEGDSIDVYL